MTARKSKAAQELGYKGGKARLVTMTPEQRSASAKAAADVRWEKFRADKKEQKTA